MKTERRVDVQDVLLIDDDELDLLLHRRILERSGRVDRVHTFQRASDALQYLTAGGPATVILLDIRMPGMDGFEFLDALSAVDPPIAVPVVIMLTTSLNQRDRERAEACELVRGYLTKPLTGHDITAITGT